MPAVRENNGKVPTGRAWFRTAMATPTFVRNVLCARGTPLASRVALTAAFWWSGIAKLTHFGDAIAEVRHFGLEPAALIATMTVVVQLAGSALVISGCAVWLGAGALAVFTLLATLLAHAFWTVPIASRGATLNTFLEHVGLIGGFVLVTLLTVRNESDRGPQR
jgi:transmembrane protein